MFAATNFSREKVRIRAQLSGSGAADVSPELMRELQEQFGAFAFRSYGMTECPMFTCGPPGDPEEKLHGTDGRPVPGAVARLVDDAGTAGRPPASRARSRRTGRSSASATSTPALNAAFTADGFFRTGDLAVADADGFLRITGRRKDIIIRKGENLSAKGIEDELAAHPKSRRRRGDRRARPASGERVCACVVLRPGAARSRSPRCAPSWRAAA